jgi:Leucine-rich repeat (LRR) protein
VDLTPLAGLNLYYFTVSHNQVEDLEAFMKVHPCSYMLYARWNRIKSIEFMRNRTDLYDYSRLFLHHNEITDYTPLKGYNFVYTDVGRDEIEPAK